MGVIGDRRTETTEEVMVLYGLKVRAKARMSCIDIAGDGWSIGFDNSGVNGVVMSGGAYSLKVLWVVKRLEGFYDHLFEKRHPEGNCFNEFIDDLKTWEGPK